MAEILLPKIDKKEFKSKLNRLDEIASEVLGVGQGCAKKIKDFHKNAFASLNSIEENIRSFPHILLMEDDAFDRVIGSQSVGAEIAIFYYLNNNLIISPLGYSKNKTFQTGMYEELLHGVTSEIVETDANEILVRRGFDIKSVTREELGPSERLGHSNPRKIGIAKSGNLIAVEGSVESEFTSFTNEIELTERGVRALATSLVRNSMGQYPLHDTHYKVYSALYNGDMYEGVEDDIQSLEGDHGIGKLVFVSI